MPGWDFPEWAMKEQGTWRDGVVNIGWTLYKFAVFIIMLKFMLWLGFWPGVF